MRLINRRELKGMPIGTLFSNSPHTELCRLIGQGQYVKHHTPIRNGNFAGQPKIQTINTYGCTTKDTVAVYEPKDYETLITKFTAFVLAGIKVSPFEDLIEPSAENLSQLISATKFASLLDVSMATLKKMQERDSNFPVAIALTPDSIRYREADIAKYIRSLKVPK